MEKITFIIFMVTGLGYLLFMFDKVKYFFSQYADKLRTIYYGIFFVSLSTIGLLELELTSVPVLNIMEPYSSILVAAVYFALNYILIFKVFDMKSDYIETRDKQFELFDYKQKFELLIMFINQINAWHQQIPSKSQLAISVFDSFKALSTKVNIITYNVNEFYGSKEFHGIHYKVVNKELEDLIPFLLEYIDRL